MAAGASAPGGRGIEAIARVRAGDPRWSRPRDRSVGLDRVRQRDGDGPVVGTAPLVDVGQWRLLGTMPRRSMVTVKPLLSVLRWMVTVPVIAWLSDPAPFIAKTSGAGALGAAVGVEAVEVVDPPQAATRSKATASRESFFISETRPRRGTRQTCITRAGYTGARAARVGRERGMEPELMRSRLGEARVGRLATVDGSGTPHVIPVCYVLDGDVIYWSCRPEAKVDPAAQAAREHPPEPPRRTGRRQLRGGLDAALVGAREG